MARKLKNVTITMDEETARWARIEAARRDQSLARFLGEILRERMLGQDAYTRAMERYLAQQPGVHRRAGEHLPTREELHDRAGIR